MATAKFAFPTDTVRFLTDLRRHNDKAWFDANRDRYESAYLEPAKAFVGDDVRSEMATDPALISELTKRWRAFVPLHRWLVEHVSPG